MSNQYAYPKWVWTPYGGWWPLPARWKRNMFIQGVGLAVASAVVLKWSADKEYRFNYPDKWIPSMLYARDFHVSFSFFATLILMDKANLWSVMEQDPVFVKYWKEQLEREGREWIEPIPAWWPTWLPPYRKTDGQN